jgi:membrane-bound lytic murein transglycosylase B
MPRFGFLRRVVGTGLAIPLLWAAGATESPAKDFSHWIKELRADASSKGIRPATLDAALNGIKLIPRVVELDRRQPEFTLTFRQYMDRVVPRSRVEKGRRKLKENRALLEEIGGKYGIPPAIIVAFWGIETDFGRVTGGFSVIPALVTLAYDGRRSTYFRGELMNALRIIDGGHIGAKAMMGSWAGAMGQPQFMPSSFLGYAVDYDGDGRKDIWNNRADVFASAANYLARSGWKKDQTWGRPVRLPKGFDVTLAGLGSRKSLGDWQKLGVRRAEGSDLPARDLMASVVLTEGPGSPAYLVYGNFHTILKWNRSNFFAIAVGSLADGIGDG